MNLKTATFGSGCFWCVEAIYKQLNGVVETIPGYSGGLVKDPSYEDVCSGATGHAEVIQLTYNEDIVSFKKLLEVFFQTHDPTSLNRQGEDVGTQYRSVLFWHTLDQKKEAIETIQLLNQSGAFENEIVTSVENFEVFYEAEDYHKNYFELHPEKAYCAAVVRPKVEKFQKVFQNSLK